MRLKLLIVRHPCDIVEEDLGSISSTFARVTFWIRKIHWHVAFGNSFLNCKVAVLVKFNGIFLPNVAPWCIFLGRTKFDQIEPL